MKRAILLLAGLACCGAVGCDTQSTAKLILSVAINSDMTGRSDVFPTSDGPVPGGNPPAPRARRISPTDELVAAMLELDQLRSGASDGDIELATRLSGLTDRIAESVGKIENLTPPSKVLVEQAREAQAVALDKAAALLPSEFAGRLDAYSQVTFGRAWDHESVEKLAVNRLVSGYLVAPYVPSNVAQVLALHAVTFPHHSMNVELYATIAERLAAGGSVREGVELARAGLRHCANHTDVSLLQNRVKRIYREHPGEVGVPMNFAGPTLRGSRFMLSSLHGRPALVVFWSTTDPVSATFLADCSGLTERFSAAELEVVGVSLDANLEDVERWYFETGLSCRQVISAEEGHAGFENPIARFYGVEALPEFFLLDRDGIVIARGAKKLKVIERELRKFSTPRLAHSS